MKIKDIRNLNVDELKAKERELRQEALNLHIQQLSGQLEKPSRLNEIRKTIARIQTILNQKATAIA